MRQRLKTALVLTCTLFGTSSLFLSLPSRAQTQRDAFAKWRPTHELAGVRYAGSGACTNCHGALTEKRLANPMSRALVPVGDCEILKTHSRLNFRNGSYSYSIVRAGTNSFYTINDGSNSISEPILFCFGQGKAGQTYVFQHKGVLYESRVSYYQEIQALDFTIIHPHAVPQSLEDGLGRPMTVEAAQGCFACHSTAVVSGGKLQLDHLMPGITCEGCHGPAEKHIAAIKAGSKNLRIFNPAKLDPDELSQEFCGACHVSFEKALVMPRQGGMINLRYQPYRIMNSRGHSGDARITCVACHNPHDKLVEEVSYYTAKCLACHAAPASPAGAATRTKAGEDAFTAKAPACPVSNERCTTCHMPKIELPGTHGTFTDHWIRIVKPGEPIPN
ncbi:MAG: multiheme c-type cytochrome [Pyrinomonadaceae bacterium]